MPHLFFYNIPELCHKLFPRKIPFFPETWENLQIPGRIIFVFLQKQALLLPPVILVQMTASSNTSLCIQCIHMMIELKLAFAWKIQCIINFINIS